MPKFLSIKLFRTINFNYKLYQFSLQYIIMDGDPMEMMIPFLSTGATCKWAVFLTLQRKKLFDLEATCFHRISLTQPSSTCCQHPKRRLISKSNLHHILINKIPKYTIQLSMVFLGWHQGPTFQRNTVHSS